MNVAAALAVILASTSCGAPKAVYHPKTVWEDSAEFIGVCHQPDEPVDGKCLATHYLGLGGRLFNMGDLGGASRAYWASAISVNLATASRWDRETLLVTAYGGLAQVAARREQPQWSRVLDLCGGLASAYVASAEGKTEHQAFQREMRRIEAAKQRAREANTAAKNANMISGMAALAGAGVGAISLEDAASTVAEGNASNREISAMSQDELEKINEVYEGVIAIANGEFLEAEFESRFLAERAIYYIQKAHDPSPYITLLRERSAANSWTELGTQTKAMSGRATFSREELEALADTLGAIEKSAHKQDRAWAVYVPPEEGYAEKARDRELQASADNKRSSTDERQLEKAGRCSRKDASCHFLARCEANGPDAGQNCGVLATLLENAKKPAEAARYTRRACELKDEAACQRVALWAAADAGKALSRTGRCKGADECNWLAKCEANDDQSCGAFLGALHARKAPDTAKRSQALCSAGRPAGCLWATISAKTAEAAVEWSGRGCALKDPITCRTLGQYYYWGKGVARDWIEAKTHYATACAAKDAVACHMVARIDADIAWSANQPSPPPDCDIECHQKRCDAHDAVSCEIVHESFKDHAPFQAAVEHECSIGRLSSCMAAGEGKLHGKPADPRAGLALWEQACAGGLQEGCARKPEADAKIAEEDAAKRGDCDGGADCLFFVKCQAGDEDHCVMFVTTKNEAKDMKRIDALIDALCTAGKAKVCAAGAHRSSKVPATQASYLEKACSLGDGQSCMQLSTSYRAGLGVPTNEPRAIEYEIKACKLGVKYACK